MMSREDHLAWCKRRALEYVEAGDLAAAITSMLSDMGKHPGTQAEGKAMAALGMAAVIQQDELAVVRFIEGFT